MAFCLGSRAHDGSTQEPQHQPSSRACLSIHVDTEQPTPFKLGFSKKSQSVDEELLSRLWALNSELKRVSVESLPRASRISCGKEKAEEGIQAGFQAVLRDLAEHVTMMQDMLITEEEWSPLDLITHDNVDQDLCPQPRSGDDAC